MKQTSFSDIAYTHKKKTTRRGHVTTLLYAKWYGLSDPAMEESLYNIESMRRFAGIDIESIPDETTLLNFRHFLESHRMTGKLFEISAPYLSERGLLLS